MSELQHAGVPGATGKNHKLVCAKRLRNLHRKSGSGMSLKRWARQWVPPEPLEEVVDTWWQNKH